MCRCVCGKGGGDSCVTVVVLHAGVASMSLGDGVDVVITSAVAVISCYTIIAS